MGTSWPPINSATSGAPRSPVPGIPRWSYPVTGTPESPPFGLVRQQRVELGGLGDRSLAGEVLADVGGGTTFDRCASLEQRDPVGLAAGQYKVGPEAGADDPLERPDA